MLIGVLGIASITIVNSVALDMLIAQQEQLNGRESSYTASFAVTADELTPELDVTNNIEALMADIHSQLDSRSIHSALEANRSMLVATPAERAGNEPGQSIMVKWTQGDIRTLQRLPVISGHLPSGIYPPGLALNEAAARAIGYPAVDQVFLAAANDDQPLTTAIAGVVADGLREPTAYGDFAVALHSFARVIIDEPVDLRIQGAALDDSRAGAVATMLVSHGFGVPDGIHRVDTVESVRSQVDFLHTVFGACAIAILIISAIGTANVGLSSVTERSRELVVRRAIGARRRDVFAQLISGALAVGTIISAVAVVLTVLAVYELVPAVIPTASSVLPPQFPWTACLAGIVAALGTAVIAGLLPAIKATRLPVGLALRE
jgi:putative ABC transport system permease protein